jgi:hypothetical protein
MLIPLGSLLEEETDEAMISDSGDGLSEALPEVVPVAKVVRPASLPE